MWVLHVHEQECVSAMYHSVLYSDFDIVVSFCSIHNKNSAGGKPWLLRRPPGPAKTRPTR